MAIKRRKRGISVGTIVMLSLCAVTLLVGGGIFLRISGDLGEMRLDPKLLAEPITQMTHSVVDPDAPITQGEGGMPDTPQDDPGMAAAPTPSPTPEPTLPPSRSLSIAAVGQVSTGTELRGSARAGDSYDFGPALAQVSAPLAAADIAIATLRTGLTDDASAFDAYNAPAALASGLSGAGVNLLSLATDRLLDHGVGGLQTTLDILSRQGVAAVGGYASEDARNALTVVELGGIRVGLLSYTAGISSAGRKAANEAQVNAATRLLTAQAAAADIAALRAQGAEVVIVMAHWGARGDQKATREVRELAEAMARAGADIILGTGPTMVQEFERMTVTDASGASHEAFIAYSLGNFLIDDSRDTGDITGVVLRLTLEWDPQTQRASITGSTYMPTWIMRYKDAGGANRYRVVPAGAETIPADMTDSIYVNMKKAYQSMVSRLGSTAAQPVTAP